MTDLQLYFQFRSEKGLKKRGVAHLVEYQERLKYEISIINTMGFAGYFLVVSDILTWALRNKIPVGPGRGSAAGSLVAFALEITHLDPIKYKLIFERFLNPDRVSMPDIDMDFCELRRNEVIEYVEQKYGRDKVAHIGTFGSLKSKASIRDVTRALGLPYALGDKLAKLTLDPIEGKSQSLQTCYEKVPELKNIRAGIVPQEQEILIWAEKMEDRIRSFGTHASGIVISKDKITRTLPLILGKDGAPTTQFEMNTVEKVGLIKFDFLGLRALTTIQRCVDIIKQRHNIDIEPLQIPVDDYEVYRKLQEGDVDGVFQLEGSSGMKDLLIKIKPNKLDDLALLVAVYRPGPLSSDMLQHYLKVRAGEASPIFAVPELEPILGDTDGMLIYQEQILEICKQLAGYTMGEADLMRRAVGKKKEKEMAAQEQKFKAGMAKNNIDIQDAHKIWEDIKAFAAYGFNRAHAACYGYISYQMAYLKTHYPLEFMTACLISDSDEVSKVIKYISYCKAIGIEILGPSINESMFQFNIAKKGNIRFGLSAIKNLGKPVEEIIQEREKNGPFTSPKDFIDRVNTSKINKKKLDSLILSGAFDEFGYTRSSLLLYVDDVLQYKKDLKSYEAKLETYLAKSKEYEERLKEIEVWENLTLTVKKNLRLQGKKKPGKKKAPVCPEILLEPEIRKNVELSDDEILRQEKELLGYFVTGHPLDGIAVDTTWTVEDIIDAVNVGELENKSSIKLIAVPSVLKEHTTKQKKQKMAYMQLEDKTGSIAGVIYSAGYNKYKHVLDPNTPIVINASLEVTRGDTGSAITVVVKGVTVHPVAVLSKLETVYITVKDEKKFLEIVSKIKESSGDTKVKIVFESNDYRVELPVQTCGFTKTELIRFNG